MGSGISPQQSNCFLLIAPLAPSAMTKSRLSSSEITATALAPLAAMSWIAIEPSPPAPPQTSTLSPGLSACGGWPNSMR
jgi:hypothetical protein